MIAMPEGHGSELPQRFPFYAVASFAGILIITGFGVYRLVVSGIQQAAPVLGTAVFISIMYVLARRARRKEIFYAVGLTLVVVYLLYLMSQGGEDGSLSFWMFSVPIISFFLLGKKWGMLVSVFAFAGIVIIFTNPAAIFFSSRLSFQQVSKIRFSIAYLLIGALSFVFEFVRAKLSAAAVERQRNLETANAYISNLSRSDSLTGCFNRLHFDEEFPRELRKALRYGTPLSLILCDIDFFKRVNDTYGHQTGDEVLVSIGKTLRDSVRTDIDWVARCGGEEFAVVLPNTPIEGAAILAERIREAVEVTRIETSTESISVTASFGVSEVTSSEETVMSMYEQSDRRLYMAKESGRNAVVFL